MKRNNSTQKTAIIVGVSGQDGAYLSKLLLDKGYKVVGASRDADSANFFRLEVLGVKSQIEIISMSLTDFPNILKAIKKYRPSEIYNLSGQSSVALSFDQPLQTVESITIGTLQLLEAIRTVDPSIRFYNASSGEMFGESKIPLRETASYHPNSPYGVAKVGAHLHTKNYRDAYGLFACSGILFNHESPLRPERFVTKKIISTACRIANGSEENLILGDLAIQRDWGWAPEYVGAMWLMLQQGTPNDFVIATGERNSLGTFVTETFSLLDLDYERYLVSSNDFLRPNEIRCSIGDPSFAREKLGWEAKSKMRDVIKMMIEYQN